MSEKVLAATLIRDTPDLAEAMRRQLPGIALVDNGSREPVEGAWLRLEANRYFSGGWNAAMEEAFRRGVEWVWMLNSDVAGASPAMLAELLDLAQRTEAVVVSPRIDPSPKHAQMRSVMVAAAPWVDWVAPLVHVDWFLANGGFDEDLPGWGCDIDLCFRAMGLKVVDGRNCLKHLWGATVKRTGDRVMYGLEHARIHLMAKHGPAIVRFAPTLYKD